ncbi:MAG: hypothetical protein WC205_02120 [Opitutaceae bacterium]|jgi:hypothetical protein
MRCAFILALCSLLFAGCITHGSKTTGNPGGSAEATARSDLTVPGPVQVVGRVIAVDMRTLAVIVELAPYSVLPTNYSDSILISRRDDLQPTARLQGSPYLQGRALGTRLLAGQPQVGDEVIFPPTIR